MCEIGIALTSDLVLGYAAFSSQPISNAQDLVLEIFKFWSKFFVVDSVGCNFVVHLEHLFDLGAIRALLGGEEGDGDVATVGVLETVYNTTHDVGGECIGGIIVSDKHELWGVLCCYG